MSQTTDVKRQEMYKCRTPPWKDTYRQRCKERLKANREKVLAHRRSLTSDSCCGPCESDNSSEKQLGIKEIMATEWAEMQKELVKNNEIPEEFLDSQHSFIVDMESLFEQITEELKLEEMQLLNMCDEYVREEEELCVSLRSLTTCNVICPLCERNSLIENKGVILCRCGLRINTEQDCITLKNVQDSLETGTKEHSRECGAKPEFTFADNYGISNLLMSCQECDFLFIII